MSSAILRHAAADSEFREQLLADPESFGAVATAIPASANIPPVKGHKLECADCHKPDAAGVYYLKISYEENCRSCHSLQFDVNNPDLRVPHGNAEHVRAFLLHGLMNLLDGGRPERPQNPQEFEFARGRFGRGSSLGHRETLVENR